jgi:hypothetical protein
MDPPVIPSADPQIVPLLARALVACVRRGSDTGHCRSALKALPDELMQPLLDAGLCEVLGCLDGLHSVQALKLLKTLVWDSETGSVHTERFARLRSAGCVGALVAAIAQAHRHEDDCDAALRNAALRERAAYTLSFLLSNDMELGELEYLITRMDGASAAMMQGAALVFDEGVVTSNTPPLGEDASWCCSFLSELIERCDDFLLHAATDPTIPLRHLSGLLTSDSDAACALGKRILEMFARQPLLACLAHPFAGQSLAASHSLVALAMASHAVQDKAGVTLWLRALLEQRDQYRGLLQLRALPRGLRL